MNSKIASVLFLLPISIFGQWESTVSPDLDPICEADFNKIKGCMNEDHTIISRIDDIPRPEAFENLALVKEVEKLARCIDFQITCSIANDFKTYLLSTIVAFREHYLNIESKCLENDTLSKIQKTCDAAPRPPSDAEDLCEKWTDGCPVKEMREEVKECTEVDVENFKMFLRKIGERCKNEVEHGKEWAKYLGLPKFDLPM